MITVPAVGAMLTVIGVFLLEAVILSAIVGALCLRRGARRPSRAWRHSRLPASRPLALTRPPAPADAPRLTKGATRRVADGLAGITSSGA